MGIDFQNVTFKYYKKASSKQLDNVTFHINEKMSLLQYLVKQVRVNLHLFNT